MTRADEIFENVMEAMQDAEEIYGVEGKDYIDLMKRISEEALSRIDTYSSWRGLTIPHLATLMQEEIKSDARLRIVPWTVKSFGELHDHTDANCYADLCDDSYSDLLRELCGSEEKFIEFVNSAQWLVDTWLKNGFLLQALHDHAAELLTKLQATYPDKEFELNESGVIYLIDDDMAIFDPTLSSGGMFEKQEDLYGLNSDDAKELRDHNLSVNPNIHSGE